MNSNRQLNDFMSVSSIYFSLKPHVNSLENLVKSNPYVNVLENPSLNPSVDSFKNRNDHYIFLFFSLILNQIIYQVKSAIGM